MGGAELGGIEKELASAVHELWELHDGFDVTHRDGRIYLEAVRGGGFIELQVAILSRRDGQAAIGA